MRFTKFGKAFLMSALSAGVILGITSCVQSYSVGFLYVVGTHTASSGDNGIISGFKIDHNKGLLTAINGLPVSSGGSNPVRTLIVTGGRFLYVLNRGANSAGNADCTTADPCSGGNVVQFSIGGNGILAAQGQAQFSQGFNPMRMFTDSSGSYLYVLDHDAPDNYATTYNPATNACTLALGAGVQTCGDITAFKIDATTGRLTKVLNSQVTAASGAPLTYFPVPAKPIDIVL
jgi:6-phosphogluconolactonase (cycloisomerase 2 family)